MFLEWSGFTPCWPSDLALKLIILPKEEIQPVVPFVFICKINVESENVFLLFFPASATVINAMSELELRKLNFHAINQFRVVEISQLLLEQNKC